LRFFKPQPHTYRTKAAERLSKLASGDVLNWAYAYLSGVWRELEGYDNGGHCDLDEVERGLQCLLGAVDALRRRDKRR